MNNITLRDFVIEGYGLVRIKARKGYLDMEVLLTPTSIHFHLYNYSIFILIFHINKRDWL